MLNYQAIIYTGELFDSNEVVDYHYTAHYRALM